MQINLPRKESNKLVIKGAHRCSGDGCFNMVSANKLTCLSCLAKEAQVIMRQQNVELSIKQCEAMLKVS